MPLPPGKMMRRTAALALGILTAACAPLPQITPVPADAPAEMVALAGAAVMIGAGDIASCGSTGDERTALIVDSIIKADSVAGSRTLSSRSATTPIPMALFGTSSAASRRHGATRRKAS